jgi:endonuclease/exonuclease/phosphatase (EEP) superfamily protein YafD
VTDERDRDRRPLLTGLAVLTGLLVLAGFVLTLLRLWQPASGPVQAPVVTLVALVPLGVPVYAVAAVCGLVLLVRGRRGAGLLALSLLGLALHVWWLAPWFHADAPAAGDGARLRVLTVNAFVHSGADGRDLVRLAHRADADVVVVEELRADVVQQALTAGLDRAYPHRFSTDQWSATALWSRLPLRDPHLVPDQTGGGSVRARVVTADGEVDLLGVHTAPPIWLRPWRADHARLLADVRRDRPDVVAGDFNATPDHVQLRRLLAEGLRDAGDLTGSGWAPTWPANGRQQVLGLGVPRFATIDHVLVGPRWTVVSLRRLDVPRSDHSAVVAELAPAR